MNFAIQGLAVGFPWNALLSSTDYYRKQLNETASLSSLEAALTLTYVITNLIAFAYLNRPAVRKETLATEFKYIRAFYVANLFTFLILGISPWLPPAISQDHGLFVMVVLVGGLLGATSAYFQHAIFAIAARIGPAKTRAYLFGFAVAGTLASAAALLTRSVAGPEQTAALNFGTTLFFLLLGLLFFECRRLSSRLSDTIGSDSGDMEDSSNQEESRTRPIAAVDGADGRVSFDRQTFRFSLLVIALSLAGTLLIFPALVASFKPVSNSQDPHEFTSLLFLFFNIGDLTGRGLSAGLSSFSAMTLLWLILLRTASLGLLGFCNREDVPTPDASYFTDDAVSALILLQGILGGALFSAAAAKAPSAMPADPGKAGKLVAATIAVALAAGALGGTVLISLVV